MEWVGMIIGDIIGILLVFFLASFFVENMFPDPPTRRNKQKLETPIKPKWRLIRKE